jgi:hypothetical protein
VAGAALAALVVAAPSHGAPSNDAFASARLINATSGSITGTTANATVENGEPALARTLQNTIWYRLPVPAPANSRPAVSAGTPYAILVTPAPADTWRDFRLTWFLLDA